MSKKTDANKPTNKPEERPVLYSVDEVSRVVDKWLRDSGVEPPELSEKPGTWDPSCLPFEVRPKGLGLGAEHASHAMFVQQQEQKVAQNPLTKKLKAQINREQRRNQQVQEQARVNAAAAAADNESDGEEDVKSKASSVGKKHSTPIKKVMPKGDQLHFAMDLAQKKKKRNKKKKKKQQNDTNMDTA